MTKATAMFRPTIPIASRFIRIPPFLNDEKNEGPTCNPIQNTNSISPKSWMKDKIEVLPVKPQCPANIPTNKTNVTPSEMPKTLIFPNRTPIDITKA